MPFSFVNEREYRGLAFASLRHLTNATMMGSIAPIDAPITTKAAFQSFSDVRFR